MSIGAALAQARHRAGLTVAQVSEQTRIREAIIREIEDDDYSTCGGDFYARGHIRAIAKVVGTDSGPLIREYDTLYRAPAALGAVSLDELLTTAAQTPKHHRLDMPALGEPRTGACLSAWRRVNLPAMGALVAAAGKSAWQRVNPPAAGDRVRQAYRSSARHLNGASLRELAAAARGSARSEMNLPAVRQVMTSALTSARRRVNWITVLALALGVVLGFGAYRLLSGSPHAAVIPPAASKPLATHHHLSPAGPRRPAARISHAAAAPSPAPARTARTLRPVHAAAFGPGGGDNPGLAHFAITGRRGRGWHTDWYTTARFGNLYQGTGLLLDMGRTVTITSVRINLGRVSGASFQLHVGTRHALTGMPPVAHVAGAGGVVRLRLRKPAHGRYVLVWFTKLPRDPAGRFQAGVHGVSLKGHA